MNTLLFDRLDRLLFAEGDGVAEQRVRVGLGLLVVWWAASWLLGGGSGLPGQFGVSPSRGTLSWSVLGSAPSAWLAGTACVFLMSCGALLVAGHCPRIAATAAFVLSVSIQRTDPLGLNAGDALLRLLLLWTALGAVVGGPAVLSRGGRPRPVIVVRLVQLQVLVMYATAAAWKLQRGRWQAGDAVHMALTDPSTSNGIWPTAVVESSTAISAVTWGTLALEFALAPLLVARRTRTLAIVLAVAMHTVFALSLRIGIFSPAALVALLSFSGHLRSSK